MNRALALLMMLAMFAGCTKSQNTSSDATSAPTAEATAAATAEASDSSSPSAPESAAAAVTASGSPVATDSSAASAAPVSDQTPGLSVSAQPATPGQGLSAADIQYGVAPTRNANVTYNPDVVIPDGGGSAVKSVSTDGLTWTIDANANHASDLAVGKILFITNRGVGRVLGMTRTGDDLALTLGPVEITDVIQEAHVSGNNLPIDPSSMYSYSAPDYPGASVDTGKLTGMVVDPDVRYASFDQAPEQIGLSLPGVTGNGPPPTTDIGGYSFTAFCCGGLGVQVAHKGSDVQVLARAVIRLGKPSVDYKLDISGGKIQTAIVILHGTVGLDMHFEASTPPDAIGNANKQFYVPVDLSFPIGGLAVPLALTVHQGFILKTGFGAKNSSLTADLAINFGGDMNAGYQGGSWGVTFPEQYSDGTPNGALNAISGISLGASAVEIAYEGKVIIGIGAFGFVTGPYVGMDAAYGVVHGSDATIGLAGPVCLAATLKTDAVAGVGYQIPQTVTKAINSILHVLNIAPITGSGGLKTGKTIYSKHLSRPNNCA